MAASEAEPCLRRVTPASESSGHSFLQSPSEDLDGLRSDIFCVTRTVPSGLTVPIRNVGVFRTPIRFARSISLLTDGWSAPRHV
jgi:hypothetical protein